MFDFVNGRDEFVINVDDTSAVGALQGSGSDVLLQTGDVVMIYCIGNVKFTLIRLIFSITDVLLDGTAIASKLTFKFYLEGTSTPQSLMFSVSNIIF